MTFDEKRKQLLTRFDECVSRVRGIIADPGWTNEAYKVYVEAASNLQSVVSTIRRLNEAEAT